MTNFMICFSVLGIQPLDTWDSFPLFQVLNDYLRTDGKSDFNDHNKDQGSILKMLIKTDFLNKICSFTSHKKIRDYMI